MLLGYQIYRKAKCECRDRNYIPVCDLSGEEKHVNGLSDGLQDVQVEIMRKFCILPPMVMVLIIIIITTISVDATFFLLIHVFMETLNFDLVNKKKNYLKNVEKEKNVAWVLVYQTIKPVTFPRDDFVLFYANSSIHLIHSHNIINSSHNLLFAH